jgi:hypothetical protein
VDLGVLRSFSQSFPRSLGLAAGRSPLRLLLGYPCLTGTLLFPEAGYLIGSGLIHVLESLCDTTICRSHPRGGSDLTAPFIATAPRFGSRRRQRNLVRPWHLRLSALSPSPRSGHPWCERSSLSGCALSSRGLPLWGSDRASMRTDTKSSHPRSSMSSFTFLGLCAPRLSITPRSDRA